MTSKFNYKEAFSRNRGILTEEEQEKLRNTTVAIPGMGGVGGIHMATLARLGIGGFHIADEDTFSVANFNRQYGAMMSTVGQNKAKVMRSIVKDINPEALIKTWDTFVTKENVSEFLEGCDLAIDSFDAYTIEMRRLFHQTAREKGIPVIVAGPLGYSVSMIIFTPDSVSFDAYFNIHEGLNEREKFLRFILGIAPMPYYLRYMKVKNENQAEHYGPSVSIAMNMCSAFAAAQAVNILFKKRHLYAAPHYHYYDPYLLKFKRGYMPWGNQNPIQRLKLLYIKKFILK